MVLNIDQNTGIIKSLYPTKELPVHLNNLSKIILYGCNKFSDHTLLLDCPSGRRWTGSQIIDSLSRIVSGLLNNGFEPGDVGFLVCEHNDYESLMTMAILMAGGVISASMPRDGYSENRIVTDSTKPKVLIGSRSDHRMMKQLKEDSNLRDSFIIWIDEFDLNGSGDDKSNNNDVTDNNNDNEDSEDYLFDVITYQQLAAHKPLSNEELVNLCNSIDSERDSCCLMITSGSTGKQKIVVNNHKTMSQSMITLDDSELWSLRPSQVLSGDIPIDHKTGFINLFLSILHGCTLAVMPPYDERLFVRFVDEYKITDALLSVAFTYKIMGFSLNSRYNIESLRDILITGARIQKNSEVVAFTKKYPHVRLRPAYGSTETMFITISSIHDWSGRLDSAGVLIGGFEAKMIDIESGELIRTHGQRGELRLKVNTMFNKYLDMPDATTDAFDEDGFYKTGDIVYIDGDNRFYIEGRTKETLYLEEDWKISPSELEEVIIQHPAVNQCAVTGMPHPVLAGHHSPRAFVQLKSGFIHSFQSNRENSLRQQVVTEQEICEFVSARVADVKRLTAGVRFLEEFPRTGTLAKIDRKLLKNLP